MPMDNDPQPRSLLDPSFDIFDVLRWATHTAYPEARIPDPGLAAGCQYCGAKHGHWKWCDRPGPGYVDEHPEARIPETPMPTISRDEWMGLIQDFLEARMKDAPDESCKTFAENLWQETAEVDLPEIDWDDIKRAEADADRMLYGGMFAAQRED